jgi:hypothetical protein
MWKKIARLFIIKTRFDAFAVIFALALGAVTRGEHYLRDYPGFGGYLLFAACTAAVFMAGAKILDATRPQAAKAVRRDRKPDSRAPRRVQRFGRTGGLPYRDTSRVSSSGSGLIMQFRPAASEAERPRQSA